MTRTVSVPLNEYEDLLSAIEEGGWWNDGDVQSRPTLIDAARIIRAYYAFRESIWNEDAALELALEPPPANT